MPTDRLWGWIGPLVAGTAITATVFYKRKMRESADFRLAVDRFRLRLPVFGSLFRKLAMSRFSRNLGLLLNVAAGCRYAGRCPWVEDRCRREKPGMTEIAPDHFVACFAVEDGRAAPV